MIIQSLILYLKRSICGVQIGESNTRINQLQRILNLKYGPLAMHREAGRAVQQNPA
jgi:hypothetical protein